jgi:hypothetical protein
MLGHVLNPMFPAAALPGAGSSLSALLAPEAT